MPTESEISLWKTKTNYLKRATGHPCPRFLDTSCFLFFLSMVFTFFIEKNSPPPSVIDLTLTTSCASFGVSLVVRLGAISVAFEGGIVSAGGLQYRQLPPAARPSARPTAVDALMDALDEQYEEDKSFTRAAVATPAACLILPDP